MAVVDVRQQLLSSSLQVTPEHPEAPVDCLCLVLLQGINLPSNFARLADRGAVPLTDVMAQRCEETRACRGTGHWETILTQWDVPHIAPKTPGV